MKRKQPEVIDLESHSESEDDWAEAEREWAAAEAEADAEGAHAGAAAASDGANGGGVAAKKPSESSAAKKRSKPSEAKAAKKLSTSPPAAAGSAASQLSWGVIWSMYSDKLTKLLTGEKAYDNLEPGCVYELLVDASHAGGGREGPATALDITPLVAMAKAKAFFESLDTDDDAHAGSAKKNWSWSPQSNQAREKLINHYGSLDAAWAKGWRWYPEPNPTPNSHKHRFYPPKALLQTLATFISTTTKDGQHPVKKNLIKVKGRLDTGCQHLTSPETIRFVASVRPFGCAALVTRPASPCSLLNRGVCLPSAAGLACLLSAGNHRRRRSDASGSPKLPLLE